MNELNAAQFEEWFYSINRSVDPKRPLHFKPFKWQQALLEQILETGQWPQLLDLPTGAGKTSALDVAIFALACNPDLPRRIVYVVDRRIIVRQTAEHVERIIDSVKSPKPGVQQHVADRLRQRSTADVPLVFAEMRGGIRLDNSWALSPDLPAVLVSTVDQVGSRLLFRGYGVTDGMRPIHAGLLGNDCLYLLDEVHLSRPFAQTLRQLGSETLNGVKGGVPRRWGVVEMSATPVGDLDPTASFPSAERRRDLLDDETLQQRMNVVKHGELVSLGSGSRPEDVIAKKVPKRALNLGGPGQAVGVVVNRVESARRVAEGIRKALKKEKRNGVVHVLTGRMRPIDRDAAWNKMQADVAAGRSRSDDPDRREVYLVATQTIEAGADLDLDAMITELASLDALRQRFGRVDRRGKRKEPAIIEVVASERQIKSNFDDPVYGTAMAATWAALETFGMSFDAGPESSDLTNLSTEGLTSPSLDAPLLLPHHLDLLAQTNPRPAENIDPDVSYWLHGPEEPRPEVNVVWRSEVPSEPDDATVEALAGLWMDCPPRATEALSVPLHAVNAWLGEPSRKQRKETPVYDVDRNGVEEVDAPNKSVIRWDGTETELVKVSRLRNGDTIVVPTSLGGLSSGVWDPESEETVPDLGDVAQWRYVTDRGFGIATLRVRTLPDVGGQPPLWEGSDPNSEDLDVARTWWKDNRGKIITKMLSSNIDDFDSQTLVDSWVVPVEIGSKKHWVVRQKLRGQAGQKTQVSFSSEADDTTHQFIGGKVRLVDHCTGVGNRAAELAEHCGADAFVEALRVAGDLHDLGKADDRFQLQLHGGDQIEAFQSELIAKSGMTSSRAVRQRIRQLSGYPKGQRHELMTVALAESSESLMEELGDDADVILHLVATHHGHCRIIPPNQKDPEPRQVSVAHGSHELSANSDHGLDRVGSTVMRRAIESQDRFGWYGVAYLEAILRLADHLRSAEESEAKNNG